MGVFENFSDLFKHAPNTQKETNPPESAGGERTSASGVKEGVPPGGGIEVLELPVDEIVIEGGVGEGEGRNEYEKAA